MALVKLRRAKYLSKNKTAPSCLTPGVHQQSISYLCKPQNTLNHQLMNSGNSTFVNGTAETLADTLYSLCYKNVTSTKETEAHNCSHFPSSNMWAGGLSQSSTFSRPPNSPEWPWTLFLSMDQLSHFLSMTKSSSLKLPLSKASTYTGTSL